MASTLLLDAWAMTMWRACWQGGIVVLVVCMICRLLPSMPTRCQSWFWRLAILKFAVVLLLPSLLNLPLLPARSTAVHEVNQHRATNRMDSMDSVISAEMSIATEMPIAAKMPAAPANRIPVSQSKAIELPSCRTILFFAWGIGVAWCLVRLLAAWYEAIRLRRRSHIIDGHSLTEQLTIQGRLFGLRRLPKLVEVVGGGSPMLIGVFRPTIVIPVETLGRLSVSEQAMVLGHELAHIRRGDLFWGLMASVVRAVFFFHPLVWWSERQLKLAQEVAADELVIAQQQYEPVDYASLLVSVISKLGRRSLVSVISVETAGTVHSLTWRLVAMARIGQTSRRILVSSGILLSAVVLLGLVPWRLVAAEPKEGDKETLPSVNVAHEKDVTATDSGVLPADLPAIENSMCIKGLCVDKKGNPVVDAQAILLHLDYRSHTQQQLQSRNSDDQGKFEFAAVPNIDNRDIGREQYLLLVRADGKATTSVQIPAPEIVPEDLKVVLSEPVKLSGMVVDPNGKPVAGAVLWTIPRLLEPVLGFRSTKTDAEGRFEILDLPYFDGARHEVPGSHGGYAWIEYLVVSVECSGFGKKQISFDTVPQSTQIILEPAAIIEGRVIFGDTGKPAAGIVVQTQTTHESKPSVSAQTQAPHGSQPYAFAQTLTDAEGHYRLESLSTGEYNIWAKADDWTVKAIDSFKAVAGQTCTAPDLQLVRGGLIVGRVIDEASGLPVDPEQDSRLTKQFHRPDVAFYGPARPRSGAACEAVPIERDGSFRLRTAPGGTYVYPRIGTFNEWGWSTQIPRPDHDGMTEVAEGQTVEIKFRVRKATSP